MKRNKAEVVDNSGKPFNSDISCNLDGWKVHTAARDNESLLVFYTNEMGLPSMEVATVVWENKLKYRLTHLLYDKIDIMKCNNTDLKVKKIKVNIDKDTDTCKTGNRT